MNDKEIECKIKKEIKEFKKTNGNIHFSQSELIMYLVQKVDKIEEKFITGEGKIGEIRGKLSILIKFIVVFIPLLFGTLGWLFSRTL